MNNAQLGNVKDLDVEIPVNNLIEYGYNYSKTFGCLWQYYRDEPVFNNASIMADFTGNNISDSFNFEEKITSQTGSDGTIKISN